MTKKIYISLIFTLCFFGNEAISQSRYSEVNDFLTYKISSFFIEQDHASQTEVIESLAGHIDKLEQVRSRKPEKHQLLHAIFFKTHRKFMKKYDPSSTFSKMILTGKYGCLSGTALYAIILEHFGFDFSVIEFTDHVNLEVSVGTRTYIFESTDPGKGFINTKDSGELNRKPNSSFARTLSSLTSVQANARGSESRRFLNSDLSLKELAGLQYYNLSIYAYNSEDYVEALEMSEKSIELYNSDRTRFMMQFAISKILRSKKISGLEKQKYLKQYVSQIQKKKLSQTI